MSRTQFRLDSITGSLAAIDAVSTSKAAPAGIEASDLEGVLGQFAGAIKRIHGDGAFTNQDAGRFVHATSQFVGSISGSAHLKISGDITGSGEVRLDKAGGTKISVPGGKLSADIAGSFEVGMSNMASEAVVFKFAGAEKFSVSKVGDTAVKGTLDVDGQATLAGATVEDLSATEGALVFHTAAKKLVDNSNVKFDGSDLFVPGLKDSSLTATHVVFAGTSGELVGEAAFAYNAGSNVLSISGSQFGHNVTVGQDLTVTGDLKVQGAMTYLDTQNLLVKDAKIVISSGSLVDGAGIYLGDEAAGENIRWNVAGDKWIASDKFAADTMQALDLSDAIVWADASGNLVEVSNADLGAAIKGRLVDGTGVDLSLDSGTGITTISIGQEVYTTSSVTFASVTGSNLTANRLMASNGSKAMVSADLISWVAGTANQITATDDADGSITLSLPQDIHTGASPQFAALNIGTAHDILADGANLKFETTGYIKFDDAEGAYELAKAGEYASFDTAFTATSIVGALIELAAGGGGGKGKQVVALASDVTVVASKYPVVLTALDLGVLVDEAGCEKRLDVYLNGQLMVQGADYSVAIATDKLNFEFALKADDVVVAVIR